MWASAAKHRAGRSCKAGKAENLQTGEEYLAAVEGSGCESGWMPVGSLR